MSPRYWVLLALAVLVALWVVVWLCARKPRPDHARGRVQFDRYEIGALERSPGVLLQIARLNDGWAEGRDEWQGDADKYRVRAAELRAEAERLQAARS